MVFSSGAPITVVGLDVTTTTWLSEDHVSSFGARRSSRTGAARPTRDLVGLHRQARQRPARSSCWSGDSPTGPVHVCRVAGPRRPRRRPAGQHRHRANRAVRARRPGGPHGAVRRGGRRHRRPDHRGLPVSPGVPLWQTADHDDELTALLVEDTRRLVEVESPSADLTAIGACASTVTDWASTLLGRKPDVLTVDGRPHLRWRWPTTLGRRPGADALSLRHGLAARHTRLVALRCRGRAPARPRQLRHEGRTGDDRSGDQPGPGRGRPGCPRRAHPAVHQRRGGGLAQLASPDHRRGHARRRRAGHGGGRTQRGVEDRAQGRRDVPRHGVRAGRARRRRAAQRGQRDRRARPSGAGRHRPGRLAGGHERGAHRGEVGHDREHRSGAGRAADRLPGVDRRRDGTGGGRDACADAGAARRRRPRRGRDQPATDGERARRPGVSACCRRRRGRRHAGSGPVLGRRRQRRQLHRRRGHADTRRARAGRRRRPRRRGAPRWSPNSPRAPACSPLSSPTCCGAR